MTDWEGRESLTNIRAPWFDKSSPYVIVCLFQNVNQHTGGKWLTHVTKRRKDNQLQSLEHPCRIS